MMDRVKTLPKISILLLLLFNFSIHASLAALGGIEESVQSDQAKILGATSTKAVSEHENYRMHEMAQKNLTVHEFTTKDGKVFAVTWVGPVHPDFSVLFGPYFKDYQNAREAAHQQNIRRRSGSLDSGDLHVELGGHMAAQRGRAWVKSILPEGFDTHDIR